MQNITWRKIFLVFLAIIFNEPQVILSQHTDKSGTYFVELSSDIESNMKKLIKY